MGFLGNSQFKKLSAEQLRQIDAQNHFIEQNEKKIEQQQYQIRELEGQLTSLHARYPDLEEVIALWRQNNELRQKNSELEAQIKEKQQFLKECGEAAETIDELQALKKKIGEYQQTVNELEQSKRSQLLVKNLYICAYTVPHIDDIAVGLFTTSLTLRDNDVLTLQSVDGARIGYVYKDFSKLYPKFEANFTLKQAISFSEACLSIGCTDLLAREQVTKEEAYRVLCQIQGGFYFLGKTDITLKQFLEEMKKRSEEVPDIGGRQLTKNILKIPEG